MYSFKDFLFFLWLRKKWLSIATLAAIAAVFSSLVLLKGFDYSKKASFLLPVTEVQTAKNVENEQELENRIIASNIKLVETYKEMVKSDQVMEELQKKFPNQTKSDLTNALTVTSSINSQIFTVVITTDNPKISQKLAADLSEIYPQVVKDSQLPREVFPLTAEANDFYRSPSIAKVLTCTVLFSLFLSTTCCFIWVSLRERKFLRSPEAVSSLVKVDVLGVVNRYEI
ncbi:hypothetical protein [Candidatus Enterococcus ferrettii]|uniref:hypothetical protein n=1 Tax=Candidatus Enterococcus ferrettii TaxID=2815324 RepID=UPI001A9C24B8|nr:hypothetical protein [Enterococcus sp. 665A]